MSGDPSSARRCVRWLVSGRVQGVGFRYHVQRAAMQHGVRGEVRNLSDGRVEVRAEGASVSLERLSRDVRRGPRGARVESVETSELDPSSWFEGFEIRY